MAEQDILSLDSPSAITLSSLADIEAEHRRWLVTEGREGQRANLRGADLSGLDLGGICLVEASLRGVLLVGADLTQADLRAADLTHANLTGAILSKGQFAGASFVRAQLQDVVAEGADLTAANFTSAVAEGIRLNESRLNNAILRDANFHHGDFTGVTMRDANARGAVFVEANLSGADLSHADCRHGNFDRANCTKALLIGTHFRGATLDGVDRDTADFTRALELKPEYLEGRYKAPSAKETPVGKEPAAVVVMETVTVEAVYVPAEEEMIAAVQRVWTGAAPEEKEPGHLKRIRMEKMLESFSRGLVVAGILWIVFAGTILTFTLNVVVQLKHINADRVAYLLGASGFAIVLAMFSMWSTLQSVRLIRDIGNIFGILKKPPLPDDPETAFDHDNQGFGRRK